MKKMNTKRTMVTAAVIACIGAVVIGFPVRANQSKSQGNIVFQEGEMALYTSDIDYLMSELDSLFAEIPDEDKVNNPGDFGYVRNNMLRSKGVIDYAGGTVVIDSYDLIYMANEIDILENTYKQIILKYLNDINTYMTADGSVTHDIVYSDDSYFPTFGDLINGISLSQEVDTETTIDNLSKDKGAWVNGEYIEGNGNDVNAAYLKGLTDGFNNAMQYCDISYVYHQHTGSSDGGGCYSNPVYHVHSDATCTSTTQTNGTRKCGCTRIYDDATSNCPSCGHWHGGGGTCEFTVPATIKVWTCGKGGSVDHYELGCGKTNATIESATIIFNE